MSTINKPSLAILWLHWILANATGVGLLCTCLAGVGHVVGVQLGIGLNLVAFVCCLVVIGYAQQLVLKPWIRYVKYWGLALPAYCFVGVQIAAIPALLTSLLIGSMVEALAGKNAHIVQLWIYLICGVAYFGTGFSLLQTPYLSVSWKNTLGWMTANGVGFAGGVFGFGLCYYCIGYAIPMTVGVASLSGTVAGAMYGIITGGALVLMLRGHDSYPVKMRY